MREIFEADGEAAYRPLETDALRRRAGVHRRPAVIAAAGGVVLAEANRAALAAPTASAWCGCAPIRRCWPSRAVTGEHRPLLDGDPEGNLRRLLDQRVPLYAEVADEVVDVDGRLASDRAGRLRCSRRSLAQP